MTQKRKDILVVGFALFAMFFGAGNLIFPPALGQGAGVELFPAILGFLLTGVGLPILGIIAVSKSGGDLVSLASKANKRFGIFLACGVILTIGPLVAIPRTSATTYEMAIAPFFPNFDPIVFSVLYFIIVLVFVLKPSSLIDNIGKILTPILLLTIITIIAKGIFNPQGMLINTGITNSFSNGFSEGYQTMDAMGATVLGGIIIGAIRAKGYTKNKDISEITLKAGMVAGLGLTIIYGGLAYLGASAGDLPMDLSRPEFIIQITSNLLGFFGQTLLAIAVGMACLTTSIGLTATVGEFFNKSSGGKLDYKATCISTAVVSMGISNMGVDKIVSLAKPVLLVLYPMIIVLVALAFLDKYVKSVEVYKGAVFSTFLISIFDVIGKFIAPIPGLTVMMQGLPLATHGFGWISPAIIMGLIFYIKDHFTNYNRKKVEYTH